MKVLFATKNPAKVKFYATRLKESGIDVITLDELNVLEDADESGETPLENAIIKADFYKSITNMPTISLDEGLYFYDVPDEIQPKTHVRRAGNKRLNDIEMVEHYVSLVDTYGKEGILKGYFHKAFVINNNGIHYTFESKNERVFTNKVSNTKAPGYPLAEIQIIPSLNKFKSELTKEEEDITISVEQAEALEFLIKTISSFEENI